MPGDSKKNQDKKKGDPKEQRKPRQAKNQKNAGEKLEDAKHSTKVPVPQKPAYEEPGPEFYKNLKRETDEIVKINEEENAKYRKKEIQSNWAKYEMPIESYEDIEEEDAGADYEKLIQTPLSVGGHFKFKHEKSWEETSGPSIYDKYFDINMQNLFTAMCTIPFHERNGLKTSIFTEIDISNMKSRSDKFKYKYYNDKKYATPDTEVLEKTCNILKSCLSDNIDDNESNRDLLKETNMFDNLSISIDSTVTDPIVLNIQEESVDKITPKTEFKGDHESKQSKDLDIELLPEKLKSCDAELLAKETDIAEELSPNKTVIQNSNPLEGEIKSDAVEKVAVTTPTPKTNLVIESPEDLEKWLDDFLDG